MSRLPASALVFLAPLAACRGQEESCSVSSHPLRYYLSVPAAQPGSDCSILICLAGADADFRRHLRRFVKARGGRPVVLVTPCTFSSANAITGRTLAPYAEVYEADLIRQVAGGLIPDVRSRLLWDEAGLVALVGDLRRSFPGQRKIFLTGFSAGGMLAWWMPSRPPDLFAAVAPVCPNFPFWAVGEGDAADVASQDRDVPVCAISGGRDPLRPSRIGLPMPPTGATLLLGGLLLVACLWRARRRRRSRKAGLILLVVLLTAGLVAGRWSGNEAQTASALRMLRGLGYSRIDWVVEPEMGHEPAEHRVLDLVAGGFSDVGR
jgi:hypothetical protein